MILLLVERKLVHKVSTFFQNTTIQYCKMFYFAATHGCRHRRREWLPSAIGTPYFMFGESVQNSFACNRCKRLGIDNHPFLMLVVHEYCRSAGKTCPPSD